MKFKLLPWHLPDFLCLLYNQLSPYCLTASLSLSSLAYWFLTKTSIDLGNKLLKLGHCGLSVDSKIASQTAEASASSVLLHAHYQE